MMKTRKPIGRITKIFDYTVLAQSTGKPLWTSGHRKVVLYSETQTKNCMMNIGTFGVDPMTPDQIARYCADFQERTGIAVTLSEPRECYGPVRNV